MWVGAAKNNVFGLKFIVFCLLKMHRDCFTGLNSLKFRDDKFDAKAEQVLRSIQKLSKIGK